jgi:hypothetical protein
MFIVGLGATLFGFTIGWITYRILRLRAGAPWISDLIAILAAIGGAAVLALFNDEILFGWYSVGLIIGFFAYFALGWGLYGEREAWRLEQSPPTSTPAQGPDSSTTD